MSDALEYHLVLSDVDVGVDVDVGTKYVGA